MEKHEEKQLRLMNLNVKSFIGALVILFCLMILTYGLTFLLPAGSYDRTVTETETIVIPNTYHSEDGGIPFWKWLCSPVLVLGADGGITIVAIILFLLIIGGAFNALDAAGIMRYLLGKLYHQYAARRYRLLAVVTLCFMLLGAFVGSFEEVVPLVPIATALAYSLGWDALVGMGMSLLAVGCGFATGVCNPFTVGVAQTLAGLPMFSGIWLRVLSFIVIYPLLLLFLTRYAKKIERDPTRSPIYDASAAERWSTLRMDFTRDNKMEKALRWFVSTLAFGVVLILSSTFLPALQDYLMPIIALIFLFAGTAAVLASGFGFKNYTSQFGKGALSILPAVLLILMASSVRYTLTEAKILDTILYKVVSFTEGMGPAGVILMIYALVLLLNCFISSGSAKAFLLMPLIAPLADLSNISRQLTVVAFAFGDGFSNVYYPTNPVLLISLGIVGVSYGKWARWSAKMQAAVLTATCALLLLGSAVGY